MPWQQLPPLTILTDPALDAPAPGGAYVLGMEVGEPVAVVFGRFRNGEAVTIPAGQYVYVGSALGGLGRRLLRHATRTDGGPHPIRPALANHFEMAPPAQKRMRWHVDFLLERPEVALTQVIALSTQRRLESDLARWLMQHPDTWIPATGLGASDAKGHTHLLGVALGADLWRELAEEMGRLGD